MESIDKKIWEVSKKLPVLQKAAQGFKFKYVTLEEIEKILIPALDEAGLAFRHLTNYLGDKNLLITIVYDTETKDERSCTLAIPDDVSLAGMNGYQSLGSALTYFRRYNLITIFDILADEDVDAVVPKAKKPKTDYVRKVKENIAKGVERTQLEAWFGKVRGLMTPEQRTEVQDLINNMRS